MTYPDLCFGATISMFEELAILVRSRQSEYGCWRGQPAYLVRRVGVNGCRGASAGDRLARTIGCELAILQMAMMDNRMLEP